MNRNKKFFALFLAVAMLVTMISACTPQQSAQPEAPQEEPAAPAAEPAQEPAAEPEAAAPAVEDVEWPKIMALGTASTGGSYYNVGVAMGTMLQSNLPTSITVEITGGALENPTLIDAGDLELAFTNEHIAYAAINGTNQFEGKPVELYTLAAGLQPGVVHFAVRADSAINSLGDLKGKVIAVGTQGNGSLSTITTIFDYFGITWEDFTPSYMSYADGVQALIDGTVDCAIVPAGVPNSSIQTLAASGTDYRLVSWSDEERDGFLAKSPYYASVDLAPGTYEGQEETVNTIATANIIICSTELDDDMVYWITRTLWENVDELYTAITGLDSSLVLENALNTTIPIAPGAMKYYEEVGLSK